jgi:hypothetical protein
MLYALLMWVFAAVVGLPEFSPEYWYFAFFSDGFRICKRPERIISERQRETALSYILQCIQVS